MQFVTVINVKSPVGGDGEASSSSSSSSDEAPRKKSSTSQAAAIASVSSGQQPPPPPLPASRFNFAKTNHQSFDMEPPATKKRELSSSANSSWGGRLPAGSQESLNSVSRQGSNPHPPCLSLAPLVPFNPPWAPSPSRPLSASNPPKPSKCFNVLFSFSSNNWTWGHKGTVTPDFWCLFWQG